jgi:hypothetical protein
VTGGALGPSRSLVRPQSGCRWRIPIRVADAGALNIFAFLDSIESTSPTITELDLDAAGIRSIIWATGYRLDFGWVDLPIFDEWGGIPGTSGA